MDITLTVLEIVAPVFFLAGIGFIWVKLVRAPLARGAGLFLALDRVVFGVLMRQIATPVAVRSYPLAESTVRTRNRWQGWSSSPL